MNILRIFAQAATRRVAYVLVALVFASIGIGIGTARAADYPNEGAAYSGCISAGATFVSSNSTLLDNSRCQRRAAGGNVYEVWVHRRVAGDWLSAGSVAGGAGILSHTWPAGQSCSNRPDKTGKPWQSSANDIREGTVSCEDGCEAVWSPNGDGTSTGFFGVTGNACKWPLEDCSKHPGTYWNPVVMGCEYPEPETCPEGQMKNAAGNCVENTCPAGMVEGPAGTCINEKNECPAGEVKSPTGQCLPGEGQCAQGEARGKDGTCKRDSDGDGVPDNEDDDPTNDDDKESFSGGDNCNSPPSCSGSPIACGQARIQWRIECNTRRNETIAGGACNAMPICKGEKCNAMEYAQLLQQWRSTCALEKLAKDGIPGQGSDGQPDWTKVSGNGDTAGDDPEAPHSDIQIGTDRLDDSGFLSGSRSCPVFPVLQLGPFGSFDINRFEWICQFVALVRGVLILLGGFIAFRIMSGGD